MQAIPPPREMWVFNGIIEFESVNNSNMPYTLTLLERLDDHFTLMMYSK